jgi:hypothetical protein
VEQREENCVENYKGFSNRISTFCVSVVPILRVFNVIALRELAMNFLGQWIPFMLVPSLSHASVSKHDAFRTTMRSDVHTIRGIADLLQNNKKTE